jgi:cytochrome c oxidase cbb3-type subunit 2
MNKTRWLVGGSLGILGMAILDILVFPHAPLTSVPPESKLSPYTTEQDRGRHVYIGLGCVYCHSQQPRDRAFGPDFARGWGRVSTPGDYVYDDPHLLGTMRTGPDLFNIASRQPSPDWHYSHLYQPRAVVSGSIMPAFPFLFANKPRAESGDHIVQVPPAFAPKSGVIVASPDAQALVAYLMYMDHSYPSDVLPKSEEKQP